MSDIAAKYPGIQFRSINYTVPGGGLRLIVTGAVHGSETCGTQAITRVLAEIDSGALVLKAGSVTFVPVTNPLAYKKGERNGERNLNRCLYPTEAPQDFEDHVANWLCPLLAQHDVLLDLHSFNAQNEAFVMVGPPDNDGAVQPFRHAAKERAMARQMGVRRHVDGWLAVYAKGVQRRQEEAARNPAAAARAQRLFNTDVRYGVGTTEYMRSTGGYALTLECGQHADPQAPHVGYRAIVNTLVHFGMLDQPAHVAPADQHAQVESLTMYEVTDKNHPDDAFSRPWGSFDRIGKGELIGTRQDGTQVVAQDDCIIMFPDARAEAGAEWFYLAQVNR
jgi:predicted deacylase